MAPELGCPTAKITWKYLAVQMIGKLQKEHGLHLPSSLIENDLENDISHLKNVKSY